MKKKLRIINIDGTEGLGKTTQVSMLVNFLKSKNIPYKIIHLEDNVESAGEACEKTIEFLEKTPKGVVISDGSIARMMVIDLLSNIHRDKITQKYEKMIHDYEVLGHKYGVANILLVLEDTKEASNRVIKREKLLGNVSSGILSEFIEKDIIKALKNFNIYTLSQQIVFDVIKVDTNDSIIEVNGNIINYLNENFEIESPSEEGDLS